MPKIKLIPPDKKQCQRNFLEGCWPDAKHFMVMGPKNLRRCTNKPVVIAYEKNVGEDGVKGSMSLCQTCWSDMIKMCGEDFATFMPITNP